MYADWTIGLPTPSTLVAWEEDRTGGTTQHHDTDDLVTITQGHCFKRDLELRTISIHP